MRGNLGGRPVGGKDKEPRTRRSANSSELEVKAKKRQATKVAAAAEGRGNLQRAFAGNGAAAPASGGGSGSASYSPSSAGQAVAAGAVLHRAGQPAAAHVVGVAELGDANDSYGASAIRDNSTGGADITSGAAAADAYPDDPLPRARREERPADVVAELDEDEQLDESGNLISHDDTSSVMGEYLKAVYARLQSETTGSASRNALEEPWLLNKLRAEGADWWLRGACAQSVCKKLDVEYGEPSYYCDIKVRCLCMCVCACVCLCA